MLNLLYSPLSILPILRVTGYKGICFNPKYVNVTVSGISVSCIPDYSETFSKICPNGYVSNKVDLIYLVELMQKDICTVEECGIFSELDIRMVRCYAVVDAAQQIIDQIEYEE